MTGMLSNWSFIFYLKALFTRISLFEMPSNKARSNFQEDLCEFSVLLCFIIFFKATHSFSKIVEASRNCDNSNLNSFSPVFQPLVPNFSWWYILEGLTELWEFCVLEKEPGSRTTAWIFIFHCFSKYMCKTFCGLWTGSPKDCKG